MFGNQNISFFLEEFHDLKFQWFFWGSAKIMPLLAQTDQNKLF